MEDENTVWHAVLNQANTDKKKLHLYEQQSQYHPQKNEESHKLPAKNACQMRKEFLLLESGNQDSFHVLHICPAIFCVSHQMKDHPILPDFVLTDQKQ